MRRIGNSLIFAILVCIPGYSWPRGRTTVDALNDASDQEVPDDHQRVKRQFTDKSDCIESDVFWSNEVQQCKECTQCPDGHQSTALFCRGGIGEQGKCERCPANHFRSSEDKNQTCHLRSICDPDAVTLAPHTSSTDTQCGPCKAGMGYMGTFCTLCSDHPEADGCENTTLTDDSTPEGSTTSPESSTPPGTTQSAAVDTPNSIPHCNCSRYIGGVIIAAFVAFILGVICTKKCQSCRCQGRSPDISKEPGSRVTYSPVSSGSPQDNHQNAQGISDQDGSVRIDAVLLSEPLSSQKSDSSTQTVDVSELGDSTDGGDVVIEMSGKARNRDEPLMESKQGAIPTQLTQQLVKLTNPCNSRDDSAVCSADEEVSEINRARRIQVRDRTSTPSTPASSAGYSSSVSLCADSLDSNEGTAENLLSESKQREICRSMSTEESSVSTVIHQPLLGAEKTPTPNYEEMDESSNLAVSLLLGGLSDRSAFNSLLSNDQAVAQKDEVQVKEEIEKAFKKATALHLEDMSDGVCNTLGQKLNPDNGPHMKNATSLAEAFGLMSGEHLNFDERRLFENLIQYQTATNPGRYTVCDLMTKLADIDRLDAVLQLALYVNRGTINQRCNVCITVDMQCNTNICADKG